MRPDEVKALYDESYASTYEAKFLTSAINIADTEFELELLGRLLADKPQWLDVACGTGYFLRHFQRVPRTGADLSPAMLDMARRGSPGVEFFEHDFRRPRPEWVDRFGLVSCMWYAYTLVDTVAEICEVIRNLSSWTSPSGTCFVPLADARMIARRDLPYHVTDNFAGQATITGILWSFDEGNGEKVHAHLVTPQVEFMTEEFERYFRSVSIVRYPHKADGVHGRPALIASDKR